MKNKKELYHYCYGNLYTKKWIYRIKTDAWDNIKGEVINCDGRYYASRKIISEYVKDLFLILRNRCKEEVYLDDVEIVLNWIFRDIAKELTDLLPPQIYYCVVFCIRNYNETLLWLGPSICSDSLSRTFFERGYDAAIRSL